MNFFKPLLLLSLLLSTITSFSQKKVKTIKIIVLNDKNLPFENATVELLLAKNSSRIKSGKTDKKGEVIFTHPIAGNYVFVAKAVGYISYKTKVLKSPFILASLTVKILPTSQVLKEIVVSGNKTPIQHLRGKVVLNIDAGITNIGTTVLELLEKSPGVMVDKEGSISLQGKSNVLVMIDEKPTYLSGSDLSNLLSSMSSSQVSQIELITNPSAKYDASGNAGIINIKTKKNTQEGFNGSISIIGGYSRDYKNNNNLLLNYKTGKINAFATASYNTNNNFTDIYALRDYFNQNGATTGILDQSTELSSLTKYRLLKTGLDFYASKNTTIGISLSGNLIKRRGGSDAIAMWKKTSGAVDSAVSTNSKSDYKFENGAVNLNLKQSIGKNQELSVDADALRYSMQNNQVFINKFLKTNGYTQGTDVQIPSTIKIYSAKADHVIHFNKNAQLESGLKSSYINTDNISDYTNINASTRSVDLGRSNHFTYKETINAVYSSFEQKLGKVNAQFGLRYENTHYNANQLGNLVKPDSSFSRNYSNFFPSGYLSYDADSLHALTFTVSRRIDRPAYQKLNPFIFIVNKYTQQKGNPYITPQYSWNLEVSHRYKQLITTTLSYSNVQNYFSQLFLSEGTNILIYTDGNVGRMHNLGLSVSLQFMPTKWWSFNGQSNFNYKKLDGYQNVNYKSSVGQLQTGLSNQFTVNKTMSAELSGYYITKARNDLQELLYPTGQLSAGLSQIILKGKGSLKFSARDIFFTQAMEGLTDFPQAQEYFKLTRDSRTFILSFNYRFGKPLKAVKRSNGGATDEMKRAGS
jgi:iron complex outermembrane receptor protein